MVSGYEINHKSKTMLEVVSRLVIRFVLYFAAARQSTLYM